jgi:protein-arginine kinase activator protein McsA
MGKTKKEAKEKPLDKMTAKELREVAMTIPEIVGVHGMNKNELVSAVKKARGIAEETAKTTSSDIREIKQQIKVFKAQRAQALENDDARKAAICRRRISRLKKKTRRAA